MNVFYGKMNQKDQLANKDNIASDDLYYSGMQPGDYVFINTTDEKTSDGKSALKRLWKFNSYGNESDGVHAKFDEIFEFKELALNDFVSLDFFKLNVKLLNHTAKQVRHKGFFKLDVVDINAFIKITKDRKDFESYILDANHHRKLVVKDSIHDFDPKTINVEICKSSNSDEYVLSTSPEFITTDLKNRFDGKQPFIFNKYGKSNSPKRSTVKAIEDKKTDDVSLIQFYELFYGNVNSEDGTYLSEIVKVISDLQGKATLKQIYQEMQNDNSLDYIQTNKNWQSNVRTEIQRHCPECKQYKQGTEQVFVQIKPGEYALRDSKTQDATTKIDEYNYELEQNDDFIGTNVIYYGVPGCGKSYYIENVVLDEEIYEVNETTGNKDNVIRTVFYPEYSNSDFIGQTIPFEEDGKIHYEFIPGPFTIALEKAIANRQEEVALVIEEINRGNAPKIFGDIFQLLDRKNGTSIYPIINVQIIRYLKKKINYPYEYIKLPANLSIYATMNTSDQNVFTLDTAFKRRWEFEKIDNEFNEEENDMMLAHVPGFATNVNWQLFVETINKRITTTSSFLSSEDKQIGKHFVSYEYLSDEKKKQFGNKIFEYLWNDVAKFNRTEWFKKEITTLDELLKHFDNRKQFFVDELNEILPLENND